MPPRVLLADDHEVVRQALKALLERHGFQVVGEAPDGRAAVDAACRLRPDIAVLDVAMPLLNGVDAARELSRVSPATRIILLTALEDAQFVPEALQAGVRGFVMKSQGIDDLEDAIRSVRRGGLYVSPGVSQGFIDAVTGGDVERGGRLSPRERQGVQLVAGGKTAKQNAHLPPNHVKNAEFYSAPGEEKTRIHA